MSENRRSQSSRRSMGGGHMGGMGTVEKPKNFKGTMKKLMVFLKPYRVSLIIVILFAVGSTVFSIAGPKILGKATTKIFEGLVNKVSAGFPFTAVSMQKSDAEASDSMNYELDYEMFGDYEWLSEAIFNVISNCAEHAEGIGSVHVFIDSYKEFIRISVQDDGEGIAEKDIPFIFDRFYTRVKSSNIRGEFHAGIGLNLAKLIVEGHFGTITVHNRESGGTEFHLILPKYMLKEKVFQM
jgi:ABC-type multidrug transport system fused ATPase/permease subunit